MKAWLTYRNKVIAEFDGEPVKQFGVRRHLTLRPQIHKDL